MPAETYAHGVSMGSRSLPNGLVAVVAGSLLGCDVVVLQVGLDVASGPFARVAVAAAGRGGQADELALQYLDPGAHVIGSGRAVTAVNGDSVERACMAAGQSPGRH